MPRRIRRRPTRDCFSRRWPAGAALPRLLAANLGNQLANPEALARLAEFAASAPELEESKMEQIAALPLGSRIKLDPWNNQITMVKTRPLALCLRARRCRSK